MAGYLTDLGREKILNGNLILSSSTLKIALLNNSSNLSKATTYMSGLLSYELSGTGYVGGHNGSGRKLVDNKSYGTINNVAYLSCDDITWPGLGAGVVAAVVLIKEGGLSDDTDTLVIGVDVFPPVETTGGSWTYQVSSSGLISFA